MTNEHFDTVSKAGIQKLGASGMFTLRMRGWYYKRIPRCLRRGALFINGFNLISEDGCQLKACN
jgi:hypothetical protein